MSTKKLFIQNHPYALSQCKKQEKFNFKICSLVLLIMHIVFSHETQHVLKDALLITFVIKYIIVEIVSPSAELPQFAVVYLGRLKRN